MLYFENFSSPDQGRTPMPACLLYLLDRVCLDRHFSWAPVSREPTLLGGFSKYAGKLPVKT